MVRRPTLSFIGRSSNIGRGRRPRPILTAEANKRQYWLTDHPLFVIFCTKIAPIMGVGPKLPMKRGDGCNLTFPTFRMVNLLPVSFKFFKLDKYYPYQIHLSDKY